MASPSARLHRLLRLAATRRSPVVAGLALVAAGAAHPVVVLASDAGAEIPDVHAAASEPVAAQVVDLSGTPTTGAASTTTTIVATEPPPAETMPAPMDPKVVAAREGSTALTGQLDQWPHPGPLTGWWGEHRGSHIHSGIDVDGDTGDAISVAGAGRVISTGYLSDYAGYGLVVLVDHGPITTLYTHLSAIHVEPGQILGSGHVVGAMGTTGNTTGSHLHFEVRRGDTPVDPRSHLPPR